MWTGGTQQRVQKRPVWVLGQNFRIDWDEDSVFFKEEHVGI